MKNPLLGLTLIASSLAPAVRAQSYVDLGGFQTPSGNIHCAAYRDAGRAELRCDLKVNTAQIPPRPKDCELDWGDSFGMNERGKPTRFCHGDTIMNPKYAKLEYGKRWSVAGFNCDSSAVRLRCTNRDGHGFELAKAKQRLF